MYLKALSKYLQYAKHWRYKYQKDSPCLSKSNILKGEVVAAKKGCFSLQSLKGGEGNNI